MSYLLNNQLLFLSSGCASTHYLSSGSCSLCPEFSTTRVVSDSTCQCQDGYAFNDGTQMSTSANCIGERERESVCGGVGRREESLPFFTSSM